jgi:hypothetical protein
MLEDVDRVSMHAGLLPSIPLPAIARSTCAARSAQNQKCAAPLPSHRQLSAFCLRIDRKNVCKYTGIRNIRKISECLSRRFRTSLPPDAMFSMPLRLATGEFRVRSKVSVRNPAGRGGTAVRRTRAVLFATVALTMLTAARVTGGFEDTNGVLTDLHTDAVFGPGGQLGGYTQSGAPAVSANVTRSYAGKDVVRHVW